VGGGSGAGGAVTRRYALRDDQWARIEPLLPGRVGHVGGTARDNRLFGFCWVVQWWVVVVSN